MVFALSEPVRLKAAMDADPTCRRAFMTLCREVGLLGFCDAVLMPCACS